LSPTSGHYDSSNTRTYVRSALRVDRAKEYYFIIYGWLKSVTENRRFERTRW